MNKYRCYFFDESFRIMAMTSIDCADDREAERVCRAMLASSRAYDGMELWSGARHISSYSRDEGDRDRVNGEAALCDDSAGDLARMPGREA